ncbi:Pkinase-domain-containing protein [Gonapodya prolifera JEL478]|uniref:Pkinase-domain-containing protein n=1 Tax=Gonapodya prolifera (strain JEL478) TaxID=1344416 RepID=A0A139AZA3_GONPJ|nr:Pkinase-domain-containing protein [Gonapodya prolifera JEL478]|eukprot:KXS21883.1 Pkinase-domain-containing protein [Gonapodya prolifera JEL478]
MNLFGFLRKIFRGKKGRNPRATSPNRAAPTPKSVAASARSKKNEYKIQGTLGEGTYGVVKMCEHVPTGMKYAAKIIQKKYLKEHRFQDLVHKEVAVLRKIRHENIVSLVEFFETPETYYLIFELATGGELFDKILEIHDSQAEQGSFTEREAAVIIATVTNALAYLHDLGIVHRDIKPENLLFKTKDASSPLTIVDFGISQVIQGDRSLLTTVCGSPGYTAPEVLRRHPYDTKVDIFALGAVTYSLLVGYGPFAEAPDMVALSDRVVTGNYQFDSPTWDPISGLAKDFIRQCLSVSPNHRPTAHTLLRHPWIVKVGSARLRLSGMYPQPLTLLSGGPSLRLWDTWSIFDN